VRYLLIAMLLACAACVPKPAPAPPPPAPVVKQSIFVLLPEPDGKTSSITVTTASGTQTLADPYQAMRVIGAGAAVSAPYAMDQAEVRRVFGAVLDTIPAEQVEFKLYFGENSDTLLPESQAQMPAILEAIRQRHSTAITVIGHTDTTAARDFNYKLGLRRAENVAAILRAQGVNNDDLFIDSHGDTDLAFKTGPGVADRRNRRVEVTVR
jgi:OOP family OmpA-OmpF porin